MYKDFLGVTYEPREEDISVIEQRRDHLIHEVSNDYDFVRFGLPNGALLFDDIKDERMILINHLIHHGYDTWPSSRLSDKVKKHVALFRCSLDFWEKFSKAKVFSKEEIYYRCLLEGPAFTEFIKKARSTCFRAKTTETNCDIEEEYYFDDYDGYNSIIHERYLIHWDDRESINDIQFAFVPTRNIDVNLFREYLDEFFDDFRISDNITLPDEFNLLSSLRNTKMYDPNKKSTHLMREFWTTDIPDGPYFAKRAVVLTSPGSTRDTGIGDPSTILKVKQLNAIARSISEITPYSANTDGPVANARYKRVLKNNLFLHLDFKKFGLTFPRILMNEFLKKYESVTNIDTSHLIIDNFTVEINNKSYRTNRGSMLGWLDAINSICVSVILHHLGKELKFDHVTFNDDVEISKKGISSPSETLELLRHAVCATIDSFDIPISLSKTFGSKSSVFLERYAYYSQYKIDMYKEQLTVNAYARSCVTDEIWQAKMLFSAAEQWTKSEYAKDRCIDTCPIEFRADERTMPLWSGGWYIQRKKGLDYSLVNSDDLGKRLGIELSKYKNKRYATPVEKVSSNETITNVTNKRSYYAYSPRDYPMDESSNSILEDIKNELEYIRESALTLTSIFAGRDQEFSANVLRVVESTTRVSL